MKGKIIIYQTNQDGKEQIAYIYTDNEVLGYRPLLCNEKHPATAKLIENCTIRFMPKNSFLTLLSSSTDFSSTIIQMLSFEFSVWINKLAAFSQKRTKARIALSLLLLQDLYKDKSSTNRTNITLPRQYIAKYAGTTLETTIRTIKLFKEENIILTEGKKIILLDKRKLIQLIS